MKKCPTCNARLPDEARFCMACGSPQGDVPPSSTFDMRAQQVQQQTNVAGDYVDQRPAVAGDDPAALRDAYLHHLIGRVSEVPLSGIDPKAASDAKARLELRAVYTGLRTLTAQECEQLAGRDLAAAMRGERRRLSALAQLDRHRRLVLLGDPGSGKSTFVHFVALCLAGEIVGLDEANLDSLTEPLPVDDEANLDSLTEPLPVDDEGDREEKPHRQPWSHGALLPVHVVLRDFAARGLPPAGERATAKHLWDFVAGELQDAALHAYEKALA